MTKECMKCGGTEFIQTPYVRACCNCGFILFLTTEVKTDGEKENNQNQENNPET